MESFYWKSFHPRSSHRVAALFFFFLLFLFFGATLLQGQQSVPDSASATHNPTPSARIELSSVGYSVPSLIDRLSEDASSVSLDFVDADHVLLTFNLKKLFHRLPICTPDHQDRLVHAVLLEVPSGRVTKEADWYLHDRRRYLWPLSPGTFLLRKLNELYIVDSSLHERLLMRFPKDLQWVTVTPDGSQIIVESARDADAAKDAKPAPPGSPVKPAPKFEAQFLDATTLVSRQTIPFDQAVNLTGTSAGYVDLVRKGDIWLVRFGPNPAQRHNIARVRSRTVPSILYASNNSLLIGRSASPGSYSVTSFTVTGRRLWQQHWNRYRVFPAVARNQENNRFGVSTLRHAQFDSLAAKPGSPQYDPDDPFQLDLPQREILQQEVQILETASGQPVLTVNLSPAVLNGQNFSISPDGLRLAALHGAELELFDLPAASGEEQAKFSSLKADVPDLDLYALDSDPFASKQDSDSPTDAAPPAASEQAGEATTDTPTEAQDSATATTATPEQKEDDKAGPVATLKVSTRAVLVDVVVTDAKGHPVKGLRQQEFQLAEDGKAQEVGSFREFTGDDAQAGPASVPAVAAKPQPNIFSNNTRAPDPGAVTLVLFDLLNTPSQDQVYARQQLIKFLESKPKNSQLALCTLSSGPNHLQLIQGFTPDEAVLIAAVRGKKGMPKGVGWQGAAAETANAVSGVTDLTQEGRMSGFQNLLGALQGMQAEQQGTDTDARVAVTVDSLMTLSRYLLGIPGRKNVVWLSGSFPLSITPPTGPDYTAAGSRNYNQQIRRVTNLLAEAQIAVYPVDVRGVTGGGISAESAGAMLGPQAQPTSAISAILSSSIPNPPLASQELDQQFGERATLTEVATATGGKAFYNSNGIREAIATAVEQGSDYYTLSYSPTNKIYNGKFRKIKVQLAEKGYSLHYRQGYFAEDTTSAARNAEFSRAIRATAMQHGSPPSRQIVFSARVIPGSKLKMNHNQVGEVLLGPAKKPVLPPVLDVQHYSIDYSLEGSEVRFIPQENATYRSMLTLMVASFDSEGTMLTAISHLGISNLEPVVYKDVIGGKLHLHQEADVPAQAVSLRLGIQDQMSSHLGTIEIPLPVPPAPDAPRRVKHALPEIEPD